MNCFLVLLITGYFICVAGKPNSFIIDGITSPVTYVRRIRSIRNAESTQASLFTGFFISDSHMLTAAQALNNFNSFEIVEDAQVFIPAIRAAVHPNFNSHTLVNNIGMLFFPPNTYTGLHPALPTLGTTLDMMVQVNGFGVVNNQGHVSDVLQSALMMVVTLDSCQQVFGDVIANENIFCAWCPPGNLCNRVCSGDQGGPVINFSIHAVIGIVSFWMNCHDQQSPQGFTLISRYLDWIEQQKTVFKLIN